MIRIDPWPLIIVISAVGLGVAVIADVGSPVRPALTFWFLFVCPGMAYVRLLQLNELWLELTLAVPLSIALNVAVSLLMLYTNTWAPGGALVMLIALSIVGVVLQLVVPQTRRQRSC
jgi:uncharacterized membrane protein